MKKDKNLHNFPFYSIIIPVYNVSKYIEDCLKSILGQSFEDFEIIIINDGSTDNSGEICDNYAINNNCIKVVHKLNSGTASARNTGLKIAKGKYIWFVDSDDLIAENSLNYLYELLKKYENISVLNFAKRDFNDHEVQEVSFQISINFFEIVQNSGDSVGMMPSSVCFSLYERNFLLGKNLKFEEDNVFEDEFFNLKLYINQRFNFLNTNFPLYLYRKGNQYSKTSLKDSESLYEKCLSKIKLFQYISQIRENKQNNEFLSYKKRVYAEYALHFLEGYLKSKSSERKENLTEFFKENILSIPIQGTYFKRSQIMRLLYNLNPSLFIGYIKLLILLQK